MAKQRLVNTKFWIDDYSSNLDPSEKLLFLYLLTNPYTEICGVYEIPLKLIALETGLDREMVLKIIERFTKDDKIFYERGWVAIKNFTKHQVKNPSVEKGIERGLLNVPKEIREKLIQTGNSLLQPDVLNLTKLNLKDIEQSSSSSKEKEEEKPFVLEEYLEKMKTDKNNHVRLISYFITRKELNPGSIAEIGEIIRRNSKIAKRIADTYTKAKIAKAVDICIEKHSDIDWGLETVYKKLTNSNL